MNTTRREFIKYVGTALAALLTRSCATCYTPPPQGYTPRPGSPTPDLRWKRLRDCWQDLGDPQLQSFDENEFSHKLRQRHADALAALVKGGMLDAAVADEIAVAFEQAIAHVQRKMATCYIGLPPQFYPRDDLMQQATLLEEMATESDIDPATVAQARAALERDIAWLAQFQAGQVPGAPEEVEVDPAAVEAARLLVELLLGRLE